MDNQHRKIKGYRDLSQGEIDLMNKVKEQGLILNALIKEVQANARVQRGVAQTTQNEEEADRLNAAEPERWASIARTHFQEGLMALTRSVAQPGFF